MAPELKLHHVSLMVSDTEQSVAFYKDVFGLRQLDRPAFKSSGAWLTTAHLEVHLVQYRAGTPPPGPRLAAPDDAHFALNTSDFDGFLHHAQSRGFAEDAPVGNRKRIMIRRHGPAGFPQVYLLDPDYNIIEVNGAV
jgi:catechol 2,3-dioxygenase-like lactoylglutathione lyase family enzyme